MLGGLGNQMFQYAVGRALSLTREAPLRLDTQDFDGYTLHNGYELDQVFNIKAQTASSGDLRKVLGWRAFSPIRRRLFRSQLARFRGPNLFVDNQSGRPPQISAIPDMSYLMGNWQSEKYFKHVDDTIRRDFSFKTPLTGRNAETAALITDCMAVSLHVRRGDIAADPTALAVHGLCSLDYYQSAVEYVTARVAHPEFFVFSDDMSWAREHLHFGFPCHYIGHNKGLDSYNDMRLMSLCNHHIIANSSFSWWGAWLNPHVEKIVVAPKQWFAADIDSSDVVPLIWVSK
jgi:hypothetical protein